ncbi:MAG: HAD-IIIC family phosphatase, partial [Burkholderiales bacterium]
MHLLPSPPDFAQRLRDARATTDPEDRIERLAALAQFRLGFLENIQLDNALVRTTASGPLAFPRVRLAILGSCTIDHLLPAIRVAGLRRRLLIEVYAGSFGQYRQELLEPPAGLRDFRPDIVLLSLTARETIARTPLGATLGEADDMVASMTAELRELWRHARDAFSPTIIQQTFLDVSEPVFGDFDRLVPGAPARVVARLNEQVTEAAAQDGVLLLDVARASARDGIDVWFDVARWLQGKIEIAPQSAQRYGDMVARIIGAQRGSSRKCLVLDLDNTLWGGVIGDDGIEGIVLGEGSALGEAHLALQRYAKTLNERGVILAVCSKNELAIAEAAFRDHPDMVLHRSDIAAFVANWNDKAENLKAIAEQLNIGLDSLVFVDDNPAERARVRDALPMVAVPELPIDPALYVRCLAGGGYFEAIAFTADDRMRAEQYAKNAQRDSL